MNKSAGLLASIIGLAGVFAALPLNAQTPAEYAQTAAYAAGHQNKDGGFTATAGGKSSLGATNSGVRVLLHRGGSVRDVLGCIKYVKSCRDASGGFALRAGAGSRT